MFLEAGDKYSTPGEQLAAWTVSGLSDDVKPKQKNMAFTRLNRRLRQLDVEIYAEPRVGRRMREIPK